MLFRLRLASSSSAAMSAWSAADSAAALSAAAPCRLSLHVDFRVSEARNSARAICYMHTHGSAFEASLCRVSFDAQS